MKRIIKDKWADYVQHVMPANAGQMQIDEGKLVFYAGFMASYAILTKDVAQLPDDQAVSTLRAIGQELMEFAQQYKATGRVP